MAIIMILMPLTMGVVAVNKRARALIVMKVMSMRLRCLGLVFDTLYGDYCPMQVNV